MGEEATYTFGGSKGPLSNRNYPHYGAFPRIATLADRDQNGITEQECEQTMNKRNCKKCLTLMTSCDTMSSSDRNGQQTQSSPIRPGFTSSRMHLFNRIRYARDCMIEILWRNPDGLGHDRRQRKQEGKTGRGMQKL